MIKRFDIEISAGVFLIIGIICLAYISIKLGKLEVIGTKGYSIYAQFEKSGGLKQGSVVEIAGVQIGKVRSIRLDNTYQAVVEMVINKDVQIQEDAIASIKTKGLIGEKYIQITPGGSDRILKDGEKIRETESAVDIEELISKYVFGKV
ncbi:MAG: outer membrane lipid asymmetry maintenance protein MlaD [Thermodesulfovibrionales bacterium]|nr:outer membrane lipid asymmetry maintenance protein MlaD [Thermodesulfovibrionales bacterium]